LYNPETLQELPYKAFKSLKKNFLTKKMIYKQFIYMEICRKIKKKDKAALFANYKNIKKCFEHAYFIK